MGQWGTCDFKQLKTLQNRLKRLENQDYDRFCRAAAKELAARLLAEVIPRTPVGDTVHHAEDVMDDDGNAVTFKRGKRKGQTKQSKVVDHVGGTLRRGWTAKTEQEAESGGTKGATAYAQSLTITKAGDVYQIEIINPVHYASYVEYGHRQQPGRYVPALGKKLKVGWAKGLFMLTISEQELRAQAPALLEKKLTKFLGECLHGE